MGTADYLSPEQILTPAQGNGRPATFIPLGCTLYYAVTGKVPFPGGGTVATKPGGIWKIRRCTRGG